MNKFDLQDAGVVVIVGSGAAGGTLANELCQRNIRCVVLEAGPGYSLADITNDAGQMRRAYAWDNTEREYVTPPPDLNRVFMGRAVGGTTLFWAGHAIRFEPHEFRPLSTYGAVAGANLLDWPLSYEDIAPWYARAEDKLGVTGTQDIPLLPANNNFKVLYNGATRLGYKRVCSGRMAINSKARDGRPACLQIGFCSSGCKIGAKWSTTYTELPKAEATGNLDLRTHAHALQIQHDKKGRVTGVLYADEQGALHVQKARVVCVAGNSIESPRLLLNSASARFPDGLANSSGQVGRHYMKHTSAGTLGVFDKPVNMHRGTSQAGMLEDERRHDPSRGFVGGYNIEAVGSGPAGLAQGYLPGVWGRELAEFAASFRNLASFTVVGEDLPMEKNRVSLHPARRDRFGLPVALIDNHDHPNDVAMARHGRERSRALLEAVGARRVYHSSVRGFGHNMGTNRMSARPRDGVVNQWGRAHDVPNLFVTDGSVFTSSGSPNPTLTIVALAMRQADHLATLFARREL